MIASAANRAFRPGTAFPKNFPTGPNIFAIRALCFLNESISTLFNFSISSIVTHYPSLIAFPGFSTCSAHATDNRSLAGIEVARLKIDRFEALSFLDKEELIIGRKGSLLDTRHVRRTHTWSLGGNQTCRISFGPFGLGKS